MRSKYGNVTIDGISYAVRLNMGIIDVRDANPWYEGIDFRWQLPNMDTEQIAAIWGLKRDEDNPYLWYQPVYFEKGKICLR